MEVNKDETVAADVSTDGEMNMDESLDVVVTNKQTLNEVQVDMESPDHVRQDQRVSSS